MKHALFLLSCFLLFPTGIILARTFKWFMHALFFIMILSMGFLHQFNIFFFTDGYLSRPTPGLEIHLSDLCAGMLLISMLLRGWKFKFLLPLTFVYITFFMIALFSWISAENSIPITSFEGMSRLDQLQFNTKLYPVFELYNMLRGFFMFFVTFQFIQSKKEIYLLLYAFVTGILLHSFIALSDRYIFHEHRIHGIFQHPNDFNTYVAMLGLFVFPLLFVYRKMKKSFFPLVLTILCIISIILSISRSSLAFFAFLGSIGAFISYWKFPSFKNVYILFLLASSAFLMGIKSYDTLYERFVTYNSYEASMEPRKKMINAAFLMLEHRPFGVGPGNFGAYSLSKYSQWTGADAGLRPHNIWILILAEMGYLGLAAFILLWGRALYLLSMAFLNRAARRDPLLFSCALGSLLAILHCHLQNWFHFCYQHTSIFLLIHVLLAVSIKIYVESKKEDSLLFEKETNSDMYAIT